MMLLGPQINCMPSKSYVIVLFVIRGYSNQCSFECVFVGDHQNIRLPCIAFSAEANVSTLH